MKISLQDLKKAVAWIEANTNADYVSLHFGDNKLVVETTDKYSAGVEINLYPEGTLMPTIKKTERL